MRHHDVLAVGGHPATTVVHRHVGFGPVHLTVPPWLAHRLGAGGPLESWALCALLLASAVGAAVGWWLLRRRRHAPRGATWRWTARASLAAGALLTVAGAAVGVNAYAGYVPTVGAAVALATGAPAAGTAMPITAQAPPVGLTGRTLAAARLPQWAAQTGITRGSSVVDVLLPAPALGMPNGNAYVYLPPGYTTARRYPVLYLLGGGPGSPSDWLYAGNLRGTADALIRSHYIQPFIVVMPRISPQWQVDYEGLNAVHGPQVMTYLTRVVVPAVDARFATVRDRLGRAIAGFSAGADAALNISLQHQSLFAIAGAIEPQGHPGSKANWVLANNPQLIAQNSPIVYIPRIAIPRPMAFYLSAGSHRPRGAVPTLAAELRARGQTVVVHDESGLGHTWVDARNDLPYLLQFASGAFGAR